MKLKDITPKTDAELDALLLDSRKQLVQLAIDMRTKQVPNVKQTSALKKTVARTLTIRRQRALKEENNG